MDVYKLFCTNLKIHKSYCYLKAIVLLSNVDGAEQVWTCVTLMSTIISSEWKICMLPESVANALPGKPQLLIRPESVFNLQWPLQEY